MMKGSIISPKFYILKLIYRDPAFITCGYFL